MDKKGLDPAFIQFLARNGCLFQYLINMKNDNISLTEKNKFIRLQRRQLLTLSFQWANSVEGHAFWRKRALRWKKYLVRDNTMNGRWQRINDRYGKNCK